MSSSSELSSLDEEEVEDDEEEDDETVVCGTTLLDGSAACACLWVETGCPFFPFLSFSSSVLLSLSLLLSVDSLSDSTPS